MSQDLLDGLRAGDRRSLAKAITLVESTRPEHREQALTLLDRVVKLAPRSLRVGLSGPPGAGKSSLIDALGTRLLQANKRVAVLAVDPSSRRSGGSILGDKTRMQQLAADSRAFIRPSPSASHLGGVTRHTREAIRLCEAAGFDIIIIETVGVGQSETAVAEMVDFFALILSPGAGDELQGIKRGVVEICDALWVNKSDLLPEAAARTQSDYQAALGLFAHRPDGWQVPVVQLSAKTGAGLDKAWAGVENFTQHLGEQNLKTRRQAQDIQWLHGEVREALWQELLDGFAYRQQLQDLEIQVRQAQLSPGRAAQQVRQRLQRAQQMDLAQRSADASTKPAGEA